MCKSPGVLPRALLLSVLVSSLVGCATPGNGDDDDAVGNDDDTPCEYPDGAVEPMELNEVLTPYRWPEALAFGGDEKELDLSRVFCNDDDIDWSPFDVLLFVSYPAW